MGQGLKSPVLVKLTFKRIQTFLFAVPRLKAMIGANVLLGETIRNELVECVNEIGGSQLEFVPTCAADDPLDKDGMQDSLKDDPASLYKLGILSRDGGHFHAAFDAENSVDKENKVQEFIGKARKLVAEKLPGVQIEFRTEPEINLQDSMSMEFGDSPVRIPQFQVCEDTGTDIANKDNDPKTPRYVSRRVEKLEGKADEFKKGKTQDIIGLLRGQFPSLDKKVEIPDDLEGLAGKGGYIAVIHADGNSIGQRRKEWVGDKKGWDAEQRNEQFFCNMRKVVRRCVIDALIETFKPETLKGLDKLPYHLLMLGGDDLLLITRPEHAFPFIINYSEQLKKFKIPYKQGENDRPISIGAGIVIASHKVPFYHLYHLAENLAGSAKKLYRSQKEERSVVDWNIATTSWIDNIEEARRKHELRDHDGKQLCAMAKPYFVLNKNKEKADTFSLQTLWENATEIIRHHEDDENENQREQLSRSQMKNFLQIISQKSLEDSEKAYERLPQVVKTKLEKMFGKNGEDLWREINANGKSLYLSQYKDLIELVEVHYLGQQTKKEKQQNKKEEHSNAD